MSATSGPNRGVLVGLGGLEPPTSPLSGMRHSQYVRHHHRVRGFFGSGSDLAARQKAAATEALGWGLVDSLPLVGCAQEPLQRKADFSSK
jgi:hypothetical protein